MILISDSKDEGDTLPTLPNDLLMHKRVIRGKIVSERWMNLVPRFGKRDVTSFMDLAYMDYLLTKKKVNLPRVIIRHMSYVINVPNHELSYGELLTIIFEAFSVPIKERKWCVVA
ncbi:hypothetical protein Dimus_016495 [Dionaea muscipula]